MRVYTQTLLLAITLLISQVSFTQTTGVLRGELIDEDGLPVPFANIKAQPQDLTYYTDAHGKFSIPLLSKEITITISHVGMATITKTYAGDALSKLQTIKLQKLSLKLPDVEVNGVRRQTSSSNSSILFDREAIEQAQALSVANVLAYLPGQTILKPTVSIQGASPLTLRSALPTGNSEQSLNNSFGVNVQVDGATISNDANMQAMNPGRMGFFSANNISHPTTITSSRAVKNGTLYSSYDAAGANSGIDLRQIPAENVESIEVISGVASARYGDYTSGLVLINRQAGITPWRVNARTNEGTQNVGINKGFRLSPSLGAINVSLDYLNSNDEPRNKLKAFQRISTGMLWTLQPKGAKLKSTFSFDFSTTIDQTRLDPDESTQRMAKFNNRNFRLSNRTEWIVNKPWLYNVSIQANYSRSRQESYDQYYLNSTAVRGIATATETSTYEGYYVPGYYLAVKLIIGEPVSASASISASSVMKWGLLNNRISAGANYNYNANKGPGMLIDPDRPRFSGTANKNDRPRSFSETPTIQNVGFYVEDHLTGKLWYRAFNVSLGARGDVQHHFLNISPRLNVNYRLSGKLTWNFAYGIATKAPALSQISPGNVYIDVPLINVYNGNTSQSLYLVHTEVITANENKDLKPYRSNTIETGFVLNAGLLNVSAYYFKRQNKDGFAGATQLVPLVLPNYTVTAAPGAKPTYVENGTYKTYNVTYTKIVNGTYNLTNGVELNVSTKKIRAIQTSFSMSTAWYRSYYMNAYNDVSLPDDANTIDYTRKAVYGVYSNTAATSTNIKTTFTSSTHIPALGMAIMLTGELFWVNRTDNEESAVYPTGYLDKDGYYYALTPEEARSPDYAHLLKDPDARTTTFTPAMVYPNVHMRLSKEIGNLLRFSFNAYNIFNIRPVEKTETGANYYNGRPSFGAELILTIK